MTPTTSPKPLDVFETHKLPTDQEHKRERSTDAPRQGLSQGDDTSLVDEEEDDSSDYESLIDSFRFERGLSLFLEIPKETIKYIYSDKLEKHVQLPSIVSFRDLCIEAFGEENVVEKRPSEAGKRRWDTILKEKSLAHESQEQDDIKEDEEKENEESERTYEDITSFLDTIKSNSKQDSQGVSENVLRKRVHEMSTRLSKQGLLCDPRDYYFNPMTMTGASGANRSREDYYDVFDDFIDDSELVDDLGLSLDELYNRSAVGAHQAADLGDDSVATTSVQTSELIYADYSNPNVFSCDDDPQNDHVDLYYEPGSGDEDDRGSYEAGYSDGDQEDSDTRTDWSDGSPKRKGWSLRGVLNNPVIKLLVQLRTDCWIYYSPKNVQSGRDHNPEQSGQGPFSAQSSSTPLMDLPVGLPSSQATVDLTTPTAKAGREAAPTSYSFPQRTPRLVSDWFRTLNQKIKEVADAYGKCRGYYSEKGNIRCEKGYQDAEISDSLQILISNIEKDPIVLRIPSLFSDIYPDPTDVAPFDSKLIRIIWDGLNVCVPTSSKKRHFSLPQASPESSAIISLLTKFENFRTKWARLILNHNQEALYQFDLNAFEAITNYPPIKSKSPDYVRRVLSSINEYNLQISGSGGKDSKEERPDSRAEDSGEGGSTPILALHGSRLDETGAEEMGMESLGASQTQNDTSSEHNFESSELRMGQDSSGRQDSPKNGALGKHKSGKGGDQGSQGIKAVNCELVFDFGVSLLEYIHGINRLRIVYKDMVSSNVVTKSVQKEQDNIPANGSRGLELMIKGHVLKRFSNVSFEGQKLKEIPHRFFLNQVKLLQIKYSYKSLTSISVRKPKIEPESKATKKRQRKDAVKASSEPPPPSATITCVDNDGSESVRKPKKPSKSATPSGRHSIGTSATSGSLASCDELQPPAVDKPADPNPSSTATQPQSKKRKKKDVADDHPSSEPHSRESAEYSRHHPLQTPRLDLHDRDASAGPTVNTDIQVREQASQEESIVERELCDPEKMVSHTV